MRGECTERGKRCGAFSSLASKVVSSLYLGWNTLMPAVSIVNQLRARVLTLLRRVACLKLLCCFRAHTHTHTHTHIEHTRPQSRAQECIAPRTLLRLLENHERFKSVVHLPELIIFPFLPELIIFPFLPPHTQLEGSKHNNAGLTGRHRSKQLPLDTGPPDAGHRSRSQE